MDQPVGDVPTDTVAALNRPHPLSKHAPSIQHLAIADLVGAVLSGRQCLTAPVDNFDRGGAFVRIHSDNDCHRHPP
jgi:hypothetical protein